MKDMKKHYREIQKVLWLVLVLNWAVAAAKIIYGYMTDSTSMTADGFHSLADGASNIIGLIGIHFCSQPTDEDHPYGHKKYETLFALGIAAMLLIVAFNLGKAGIGRIINPVVPQVDFLSFAVMIITVTVNITVMIYEYRRGKQLQSDILIVDSMHTRADIFTSLSVIVALIFVKLGFPIVDPFITLLISGFIAYSAFIIIRQESGILCDAAAINDTKKIEAVVLRIKGVQSCHKIRTRGRPDDVYLDLHIQIEVDMKIGDSHQLTHIIQKEIMDAFPQIVDVLVHLEPKSGLCR
ncbi:MAG: Cation diffusion facilitator family transporter [Syntrophaceae bacterium]|nr:MAG: Cation diffusion facilitator family transporter [Syntrophaceae bacterium]